MTPFQITFLDFPESDPVWIAVQDRIEKLEHFFARIVRCEVVIACPHRHRHADRLYQIKIHLFIPGDDIIVNRHPTQNEAHRDIYVAIRDAFNAAERMLEDKNRKFRGHVKFHDATYEEGKISKIFYQEGYGFLVGQSGREFYFSQNSLTNKNFEHLLVGQKVRFVEEPGEKGPQITSMATL